MPALFSEFAATDRPLEHPAADTLGRVAFAERIADELCAARSSRDYLVLSLDGEAGSGKTTLKNFVRHALAARGSAEKPAALLVDFNPAEFGDALALTRGFFEQVAEQLASASPSAPEQAEVAAAWSRLGATLSPSSTAAGGNGAALREAQQTLRTQMEALPFPVVVFIDEIDSLPAPELHALLRLLGSKARLPNLVCFLLFRKAGVLETSAATGAASASDTLRKLIHVELEMPEAPDTLLRRQLETGLEQRLGAVTFPSRPRERWNDVIGSAVWPLFSTPREVQRFLSAFAFQFDGFFNATERVLAVNPIDLVLLETLRMFAPSVYAELRGTFRRRETRIVRLMSGREEERKEVRLEIDGSVQRLPLSNRHKRSITAALQHLVPLGTGGVHGGRDDWDRDLRFCSPRHVERYFHFGAVTDALPAHRLIELARATNDRVRLEALLLQAAADNTLPEVLDRLPPLIQGQPETQVTIASVALCGICDQIPTAAPDDLETRLVKFACELFAEVKNPLRRENIVAALLDDPTRLTGPILLLHALRPRSDLTNGAALSTLSVEQFRRLVTPALSKLQEAALSGAIWHSREAGALIRRWWEWSSHKDELQRWLLNQVKEPGHARAWLRTFLAPSPTAPGKELLLQFEELRQYCDPAPLAIAALQAPGDAVDRAAAKRLSHVLANKGTANGLTLRTVSVPLEECGV